MTSKTYSQSICRRRRADRSGKQLCIRPTPHVPWQPSPALPTHSPWKHSVGNMNHSDNNSQSSATFAHDANEDNDGMQGTKCKSCNFNPAKDSVAPLSLLCSIPVEPQKTGQALRDLTWAVSMLLQSHRLHLGPCSLKLCPHNKRCFRVLLHAYRTIWINNENNKMHSEIVTFRSGEGCVVKHTVEDTLQMLFCLGGYQ